MANGCWRSPSSSFRGQLSNPFDIQHAPWKPFGRRQCNPARLRQQEVDALHAKAQTALKRAHKIFNKADEKPRDMSRESYGRQMAYRRSNFGSTVGLQRSDPLIDIRPPRECFLATQAYSILNLVTDVADTHHERKLEAKVDLRKPRSKKVVDIPPPVLLPPFNLHIKQRLLSKSYYLGGSLRVRRETQMNKEKEKAKAQKPERESFFVAGSGIRVDGSRSAEIPAGLGYQSYQTVNHKKSGTVILNGPTYSRQQDRLEEQRPMQIEDARINVEEKLEDYNRNYQARRELSCRAAEYVKEKRRTRMTLFKEHERHSLEVKAAIAAYKQK